jgi:hypothetical protein
MSGALLRVCEYGQIVCDLTVLGALGKKDGWLRIETFVAHDMQTEGNEEPIMVHYGVFNAGRQDRLLGEGQSGVL